MPIISLYTEEDFPQYVAQQIAEKMREDFLSGDFQHDVEVRRFKTDVLVNANKLHADVRFRRDDFWTDQKIAEVQKVFMISIGSILDETDYQGKYSCLVVAEPLGAAWSQEVVR